MTNIPKYIFSYIFFVLPLLYTIKNWYVLLTGHSINMKYVNTNVSLRFTTKLLILAFENYY